MSDSLHSHHSNGRGLRSSHFSLSALLFAFSPSWCSGLFIIAYERQLLELSIDSALKTVSFSFHVLNSCLSDWHLTAPRLHIHHVLSVASSCPEPESLKSAPTMESGGVSSKKSVLFPKTLSCSSMMSWRMSATISKRKSKEPGGP